MGKAFSRLLVDMRKDYFVGAFNKIKFSSIGATCNQHDTKSQPKVKKIIWEMEKKSFGTMYIKFLRQ